MTTKESIKQAIYDHLQKVREAVVAELPNGDVQGVMEAESENIYQLMRALTETRALNEAVINTGSQLALSVKEKSEEPRPRLTLFLKNLYCRGNSPTTEIGAEETACASISLSWIFNTPA